MISINDKLRYSSFVQRLYGYASWAKGLIARSEAGKALHFAEAYRVSVGLGTPKTRPAKLTEWVENPDKSSIWRDLDLGKKSYPSHSCKPHVSKGMVLKAPAGNERGVILVSFEYNLLNLMEAENLDELLRTYTIIVFTSWFPPSYPALWQLAHYPDSDVYVSISHPWEAEDRGYLDWGAKTLPLYMSDFINPDRITPAPRDQRDIDVIMVANWAPFKRHWVLFQALYDMDRDLNVVLVGQPDSGRTVDDVEAEAKAYGVEHMITFHNSVTVDEVIGLMNRAKVSVICSKREGSCVVNAEALFCDTPIGLLEGAQIGSASYVNDQTGRFLRESHMAEDLARFLDEHNTYSPRKWAEANINNVINSQKLNARLKGGAATHGQPWTTDCAAIDWWGDPGYAEESDKAKLATTYDALNAKHSLTFQLMGSQ